MPNFRAQAAIFPGRCVVSGDTFRDRGKLAHDLLEHHHVRREGSAALEGESHVGHAPAVVFRAHQAVYWDAHVLQEDLAELALPGEGRQRADLHAVETHGDAEPADAAMLAGVWIRPNQQFTIVGDLGEGGPDLVTIEHVVVTVALRPGLERGQIGAGARL